MLAVVCACLLTVGHGYAAAPVRIVPRPQPRASAVLHVTTTQDVLITAGSGTAAASPGSGQIQTRNLLGYTQTNGTFDDRDRMEVRLTIERLESLQMINGVAKPSRDVAAFLGKSLTAVVDRGGNLVEITLPQDLQAMAATIKQLVAGAFGVSRLLPATEMAVGERATVISDIPLRVPGSSETAPLRARSLVTLRSVGEGPAARARLEQQLEAADETAMRVTGTGTIEVNLDRGYVAASTTECTVEPGMPAGGSSAPPGLAVRATIKVTLAVTE